MSGSPVYIDGRLVGAVSYSLGAFSKEPIAGITPIGEMTEAALLDGPRPATPVSARLELPVTRESVTAAFRASFAWFRPFAERPADVEVVSGHRRADQQPAGTAAASHRHAARHERIQTRSDGPGRQRLPGVGIHPRRRRRRGGRRSGVSRAG